MESRVVPENNEAMTESYVMIDPAGRFFDNVQGSYRYSEANFEDRCRESFEAGINRPRKVSPERRRI